ncbi:MAG: outer membrane protein assembly factor BamB family protein [Pirellulales bacterium]
MNHFSSRWLFIAALFVSSACAISSNADDFRTWKSSNRQFSIEAKFIRYDSATGSVTLEKRDGSKLIVVSAKLSADDQRHIKLLVKNIVAGFSSDAKNTSQDWPWWRGPSSNGIAAPGQSVPTTWNETNNVVWKSPVPGRGHSSPVVVGNKIFLTTADKQQQTQSVLCYARDTGKPLWATVISRGGFNQKIHGKNTHASPTLACNGDQLFVVFNSHDSVQLSSLDLNGKIIWQTRPEPFEPMMFEFGYAPSVLLYKNMVIVTGEFEQGYMVAYDQKSGKPRWDVSRSMISFSTPVVAHVAGRDQLLISGGSRVSSYDPNNGKLLWETEATTSATCGTMVWDDELVFASGGFPKKETVAIKADGSGEVVWSNQIKCYEQSMLAYQGHIYAMSDDGIAFCWNAKTGEQKWKVRLGGPVSSSPVLVGDNIYQANEKGVLFVFKANPEGFEEVARNQLGDEMFATATICGNQIFLRTADSSNGPRQETLYCIAN